MSQAKYYVLLFLVCLIWGATPAFGKLTVEAFSPLLITSMRFGCIALILFTWMFITKDRKGFRPSKDVLIVMMAMGFMGMLVHNGLLFLGLNYTTATNTALIESIGPTVTTVLAFLFLGERLNRYGWLGIFISCIGALTIVCKGSISVLLNLSFNIGDVLILVCEMAWSCYVVISWRVNGKIGTIALTAWSGLFGALMCFVVGLFSGSLHFYEVTNTSLFAFSFLVIFSGVIAFVGWNYGVQHVGASKAGVFIYLVPLTGGFVGVLALGEDISIAQLVGAVLILGGVVLTVRSKVQLHEEKKEQKGAGEKDLLKKFPELAQEHNQKIDAANKAAASAKIIQKMADVAEQAASQAQNSEQSPLAGGQDQSQAQPSQVLSDQIDRIVKEYNIGEDYFAAKAELGELNQESETKVEDKNKTRVQKAEQTVLDLVREEAVVSQNIESVMHEIKKDSETLATVEQQGLKASLEDPNTNIEAEHLNDKEIALADATLSLELPIKVDSNQALESEKAEQEISISDIQLALNRFNDAVQLLNNSVDVIVASQEQMGEKDKARVIALVQALNDNAQKINNLKDNA